MKLFNFTILTFFVFFSMSNAIGQANAQLSVLTQNTGIVSLGGTVNIQLDIINTGPTSNIGVNKVRCQLSVPSQLVSIPATQMGLPAGWFITTNNGSVITVCNGSDIIVPGDARIILISVQGNTVGGPSTVSGQLSFGPGTAVCTGPGALPGDNPADNTSTSSIQVVNTTPVTLTNFNAALVNCQPVLNWITETEINSDRFEIERGTLDNSNWKLMGSVMAIGNSNSKATYNFIDRNIPVSSGKVLYRLKMIDKDGSYKYSKILPVFINCNTTGVYAYPNPVKNGRLYISLTGAHGYAQATLTAMSGQVVLKSKIGNGTSDLNTSNIAPGEYILNIRDLNGYDKKIKVLIQH